MSTPCCRLRAYLCSNLCLRGPNALPQYSCIMQMTLNASGSAQLPTGPVTVMRGRCPDETVGQHTDVSHELPHCRHPAGSAGDDGTTLVGMDGTPRLDDGQGMPAPDANNPCLPGVHY